MTRALVLATAAILVAGSALAQQPGDTRYTGDVGRYADRDGGRTAMAAGIATAASIATADGPQSPSTNRPDFGGRAFQASGEVTNLPRQDNDRAVSLRIDGRRAWQVCTDSDFRGRCQVFERDVRDLRQFGLAGQISSMRPVR